MKVWVWLLLLLLNVVLLVYFNMDRWLPKAQVVRTEIHPEKIKLLRDGDFANLTKKVPATPTAKGCYKWGQFTTASLPAAQEIVAGLGLVADVVEEPNTSQERRFWVYYPPLATPALARQKADEIKRLGIDELYIVQDSQWRNAISFGLFSDESLANALLKELRSKGLANAVKSLRNQGAATSSLLAKDVSQDAALALYKVRPEFVGTDVRQIPCP